MGGPGPVVVVWAAPVPRPGPAGDIGTTPELETSAGGDSSYGTAPPAVASRIGLEHPSYGGWKMNVLLTVYAVLYLLVAAAFLIMAGGA